MHIGYCTNTYAREPGYRRCCTYGHNRRGLATAKGIRDRGCACAYAGYNSGAARYTRYTCVTARPYATRSIIAQCQRCTDTKLPAAVDSCWRCIY